MDISATIWFLTIAFIGILFLVDLGAALLKPRVVQFKEALLASIFYIAVALLFGVFVTLHLGSQWGTEFFAGYLLEKSLSVDNLFVFVVIISLFAVPEKFQQRVLIIGIFLALILRVIFIAIGATLLSLFSFMFLLFGILLIWTAIQLYRHRNQDPDINDNILVRGLRNRLPFTEDYGEGKFRITKNGSAYFTPLLLVLVAIATTDLLFALDSIPAIFGVTQEVYLIFTANAFALLGLRALFFLVTGLLDRLVYLSTGLSAVLGLIGIKLILLFFHKQWNQIPEIPTSYSLAIIIIILLATTVTSLAYSKKHPESRAHPGSLRSTDERDKN